MDPMSESSIVLETKGFLIVIRTSSRVWAHDKRTKKNYNFTVTGALVSNPQSAQYQPAVLLCDGVENHFFGRTAAVFKSETPITDFKCLDGPTDVWLALDVDGTCYVPAWDIQVPAPLGRTCFEIGNPARFGRFHTSRL
jgi:hypothetical protein